MRVRECMPARTSTNLVVHIHLYTGSGDRKETKSGHAQSLPTTINIAQKGSTFLGGGSTTFPTSF